MTKNTSPLTFRPALAEAGPAADGVSVAVDVRLFGSADNLLAEATMTPVEALVLAERITAAARYALERGERMARA